MNYPTAGNSGPPGQGLNHAAPPSAGRAHPSQRDELPLSFGSSPPQPVALNHAVHTSGRWGLPMHAKPLPQSTQAPPARYPGYSYIPAPARSLVRVLGGISVWRLSNIPLLLGGTLGSGISRARSPSPGQHANNVLLYSPNTHYVTRAKYM